MNWNRPITEEEWSLIDQYLDAELTGTAKQQFEERLQHDADWKEAVDSVRLIRMGIKEDAIRGKMRQYHEELPPRGSLKPISGKKGLSVRMNWAAAAAGILLIATLGWWYFGGVGRLSDSEKLYQAYYLPDPGLLTAMGPAEDFEFQQAMVEYKAGNFREAALAWEKLLPRMPESDTLRYFLACAWQGDREWEKAQPLLEELVQKPDAAFAQDAAWYLGLLYMRRGDTSQAIEWVSKSAHPSKQALLNALKP